ncbi:putative oxidoreductase [Posidoniimonas polymericola]|uniref:Putative oxidoreductase n=1 Tax=Posidoniimonas polymericola TaxID=2528002 RepID=A0A5C5YM86_9BACT|nr:SDR family NAD(P)-dependent oxidoreductase [Posidoniimonas polymericola]TWT76034.1 putative oxidoreductase [Posidoniimonas polymericola]
MSYWNGKSALVTGGSAGLGLALARTLVTEGARVTICGRGPDRLEKAADGLRGLGGDVLCVACDVAHAGETRRAVDAAAERFGGLHFACCCAGESMRGDVISTSRERFEELMAVNFLAAVDMAHAAGPLLEANRGHLTFIGSLASKFAPRYLGAYPASKHAVAALAQQLRLERGPEGLHVLLVCPGPIARPDGGQRYQQQTSDLPEAANRPGGGAKVKSIAPDVLSQKLLAACEKRQSELVIPAKARILAALTQLSPKWGDWALSKQTSK